MLAIIKIFFIKALCSSTNKIMTHNTKGTQLICIGIKNKYIVNNMFFKPTFYYIYLTIAMLLYEKAIDKSQRFFIIHYLKQWTFFIILFYFLYSYIVLYGFNCMDKNNKTYFFNVIRMYYSSIASHHDVILAINEW